MGKTNRTTLSFSVTLFLAAIVLLVVALPVHAQAGGPTLQNCYSDLYHAASDCDRLASGQFDLAIAVTGGDGVVVGPSAKDCFSDAFHAASDCDRIASGWR